MILAIVCYTHTQGCLKPITVEIPKGSLLDPSDTAAVVGGNILMSQRIVDVVFRAFSACAASQGCMNNTTFGDETVGYYETVAGGAGTDSLTAVSLLLLSVYLFVNGQWWQGSVIKTILR